MKKILVVTHCLLNTASKVESYNIEEIKEESNLRKELLKKVFEEDIQLIQLPCPEFTLYGGSRWGHVKSQFDNTFFRNHCRRILQPIMDQLKEYDRNKDKYSILGVVAIDGSPSCGYNFTFDGNWGGEFGGCPNLTEKIQIINLVEQSGVFIEELKKLLDEEEIKIDIKTLKDEITYLKNL